MVSRREELHRNILELLVVKNAILPFTKEKTINPIHIQTDNTIALSYLLKMEGTTDKTLKQGHLEIFDIEADHNYCRISPRYSEYKRLLGMEAIPNSIPTYLPENGMPVIDLFASRLSNQIEKHFAWKPDPHSLATDAMQQEWNQEIIYAFSPFSLIQRVLCKIGKEKVSTIP